MSPILLASGNPHKRDELQRALGATPGSIVLPAEWRQKQSIAASIPDPVEDGADYLANAVIKAQAFSLWSGLPALADDTGLEVEALDRAPGLYSARFAGEDASYADNVDKLLSLLEDQGNRSAEFITVLALCCGEELRYQTRGVCSGVITPARRGANGFGYDPVFLPSGETQTFAEMTPDHKDSMSHRGRALQQLRHDIETGRFPIPLTLTAS